MERDILMSKDKKDRRWDGRSRVSTKQYKKNYDDIFKKEQDELNESYKQSIRNKNESRWPKLKDYTQRLHTNLYFTRRRLDVIQAKQK